MAVKRTGQLDFVDALVPRTTPGSGTLDRIAGLVAWDRFVPIMADLQDDGPGRPAWPVLILFKGLLLQALYGLSDRALEEALADRLSFRRFVGLSLTETVPDHCVFSRFRQDLIEAGLIQALFAEFDRQLDEAGLIVRRGTLLDATLIPTTARPPTPTRPSRDPQARFAKRQGKEGFTFGYKAHVGVDQGSGLIRTVVTTPANVNETVVADRLIRGDERAVWADAAYHTRAREKALRARGIKARLQRRANKHHPELPERLKRYNRLIARTRAGVETTFATLKHRMGLGVIRYVGLAKASAQVLLGALAFNLRRLAVLSDPGRSAGPPLRAAMAA